MTKDWEDVKDEACQLCRAGRSLKYLEAHFARHRGFRASWVDLFAVRVVY